LEENTKNSLRKYYREARISAPDKEKMSEIIVSHIKSLEIYQKSRTPILYWARNCEVSLLEICETRWENGQNFGLPHCNDKKGDMEIFLANKNDMLLDKYGILAPFPLQENVILPQSIDLIFVPALAFDLLGNRLGQGGGYYDKFLPKCEKAVKIGVCFSCQISETPLPVGDLDVKMDFILSEKGLIKC